MANNWISRVPHVADGEQVSAAITGRPTRALEARDNYLKARLDAAALGESVILYDRSVESTVKVGQAVYFNAANSRFEAALAQVEEDAESHAMVPSASCEVVGIVLYKHNSTLADIGALGCVTVDLTEAVADPTDSARYYLSSLEAGKLVKQRPPISVPVLFNFGNGQVFVLPALRDFLEDHTHYSFDLHCTPAGEVVAPDVGERHTITAADDELPGWLPADHASFDGLAPAGAVFGYNLAAHPELSRLWPPVPVSSAGLILDRGIDRLGGTVVPLGSDGLCVLDRNGIWWMSDCYDDVPWPTDFSTGDSEVEGPSEGEVECPRLESMKLTLLYSVMTFATDKTVVTSLTSEDNSPISFVNCDDEPATTGDLVAKFNLDFLVDDAEDAEGSLVFKELTGLTLKKGRVVEGIIAGANVIINSSNSFENDDDDTVHQGIMTIEVTTEADQRELTPSIVRLGHAIERSDVDVPYIGFAAGKNSGIRMRFGVPGAGMPSTPKARLRLTCLARSAGTFPDLSASYRRLPRVTAVTAVPGSDSPLEIVTTKSVTADTYFDILSDPVDIAAGDTLLISLLRSTGDGYTGEIGIIRAIVVVSAT